MDRLSLEKHLAAYDDGVIRAGTLRDYVQDINLDERGLHLDIALPFAAGRYANELRAALSEALALDDEKFHLNIRWQVDAMPVQGSLKAVPNIKNMIAVASGKGGVGKSTVSANLALAMAAEGARVGVLDADIYGPSQPRMLGVENAKPELLAEKKMLPVDAGGVVLMSIGLLVDAEQPTIWRGPMVTQALHQMLSETKWPELDYLIVDLPPGTGDTQLSLAQRIPVSGAVIVSTPQEIALLDARKGLRMFEKVGINVLGVVENMSMHICSNCGHADPVFGHGGAEQMAQQYQVPVLGQLPLDAKVREQADNGNPTVRDEPDSARAKPFFDLARRSMLALSQAGAAEFPEIVIED